MLGQVAFPVEFCSGSRFENLRGQLPRHYGSFTQLTGMSLGAIRASCPLPSFLVSALG